MEKLNSFLDPIIGPESVNLGLNLGDTTVPKMMPMPPMLPMPSMPPMPPMMPLQMPMMPPQMSPEIMQQYMSMMRSMYPMAFMMPPPWAMMQQQGQKPTTAVAVPPAVKEEEPVKQEELTPPPPPVALVAESPPAPKQESALMLPKFIAPTTNQFRVAKGPPTDKPPVNEWEARKQKKQPPPTIDDPDKITLIDHNHFPKHYPKGTDPRGMIEFKWLEAIIKKYNIPYKLKKKKDGLRNCSLLCESYSHFMFCVNYYNFDVEQINNIIFYDNRYHYEEEDSRTNCTHD